jgi:hypothetical protein
VTRVDSNGTSDAQAYHYAPGDEDWPEIWRKDKAVERRSTDKQGRGAV